MTKSHNSKITQKELRTMAMNAKDLQDKIVYRGFVDESLDPDIEYDYSEDTLVMITPLGEFIGSTPDGNTTKEIIDEQSILEMANQTEEILLDKDHQSMRPVSERNTEAMGWISQLKAITDLGDMSGLYGVIKWAGDGLRLAKERAYRFLSPVFQLDNDGRAIRLVNVALTNRPNLKMPPIINSETNATDESANISITNSKKDTDLMNKEEIETMIKDMVKQAIVENSKTEEKTEVVNSEVTVDVSNEETTKEEPKVEETKEETKVEEPKVEETKVEETKVEETKVEEPKVEETKEEEKEVIKVDVLNSATPTLGTSVNGMDKWRSLKGDAFFKYLREHPEIK